MINIFLLFISAGFVFLPQIIYFLQNPATFTARIDTVSIFNHLPEYYQRYSTNNIFEVLFWQLIDTIKVFNFGGDIGFYFYGYQGPLLSPIIGITTLIGFLFSIRYLKNDRNLLLVIWLLAVIFLGGVLTIDAPSSQRIIGAIPTLILLCGVFIEKLIKMKVDCIKIVLILLFILNGFWDYKIYFADYIHSQAGWAQREPATQIAYYLKTLGPSWKVYMLRENTWLYFHHGVIRFIDPSISGEDVSNSDDVIPVKEKINKNIVYIMPPYSPSLNKIKQYYPQGKEHFFTNPIGNTPSFISYEITTKPN